MHRYFRPPAGQPRDVHVHVCAAGSQWERDHLLFRDYLRADPAACRRYAEAKRANVRRWSDDGWAYTEAKTGVVLDILEQAVDWAQATNWAPLLVLTRSPSPTRAEIPPTLGLSTYTDGHGVPHQ